MQAESETQTQSPMVKHSSSLPPKLYDIANKIRLTGWITLWVQLALALVSGFILLVAATGRNVSEQPIAGLGIGLFWAGCGVIVLLFAVYWDFRYTRIGRRLANPNHALHPSKADTIATIRLGIAVSLLGILIAIIGSGASTAVLVAKAVSQPPGVAITDPYKIIRAMDVFVVVANITVIAANFIGNIASMWLLETVNQH